MKHTTFFYLVATAFALVGATACSSGDDGDEPANPTPTNPTERKLVIGASANPWLDENGNARETRGAVITTETLQRFLMKAYNSGESLADYIVNRDNEWIPTPNHWPGDYSTQISFFAHTAGTCNYESGNYYVAFICEEASADQKDLLLSKITNVTHSGTGGVIWFTFDHACAAVDFKIQISNKLREKLGHDLTVKSVVLKHIAKVGDCSFSTGEWTNVGTYTDYTLTTGDMTVRTDPQSFFCQTLFIIPQTLGSESKLEIGYTSSSQKDTTAVISLKDIEWKAGHLYPINIVLGTTLIK